MRLDCEVVPRGSDELVTLCGLNLRRAPPEHVTRPEVVEAVDV
jgi:hypothetical protein